MRCSSLTAAKFFLEAADSPNALVAALLEMLTDPEIAD
jgi:hypothetical protein